MIFVVLCLTAFGVLSYVTANGDYKISSKTAQTAQAYYRASRRSEQKLQRIDGLALQARSDAKRAAASGTCDGLKNEAEYEKAPEVEAILKSTASMREKYEKCCAAFSRILLSKEGGITFSGASGTSLPLTGAFAVDDDQNRKLEVTLVVDPLSDTRRCRVVSRRLVDALPAEEESEPTLDLWQGNGK